MSNDIRNLFNLKDPNIKFDENCVEKVDQTLYIHGSLSYDVTDCPECQASESIVRNGTRKAKITYLECAGQACHLMLRKQRYICKVCSKSFTAETSLVERHCSISLSTKQRIADFTT